MSMLDVVAFDDRSQKHPTDANLPEWLPKHEFLMIIVAPAGSGKTTLLLNIILRIYKQYWHRILIFSPTIHNDAKWQHVKDAQGVLMNSERRDNKERKKPAMGTDEGEEVKGGVAGVEQDDDEEWDTNPEVDDIKKLKENQIIDPFDKVSKNNSNRVKRRIGLSKEWYERALGMDNYGLPSSSSSANPSVYIQNQKKVQRDRLMSKNQRINRLSSIIIRPPMPEMHKQLRDVGSSIFRDPWQEAREKQGKKQGKKQQNTTVKKEVPKPPTEPAASPVNGSDPLSIEEDDLYEEYDENKLMSIMKEIDDKVKEAGESGKDMVQSIDRTLWVFDDMVGSGLFNNKRNNAFKRLTVRRRHFYSSLVGVTQAYKEIPKTTRTNANSLILFRIDSDEELHTIYKEYPMGLKLKDWLRIVDYCTREPYHFIMFNLQTSDLNHRITHNFDNPLTLEKQSQILGHAPRETFDNADDDDEDDDGYETSVY